MELKKCNTATGIHNWFPERTKKMQRRTGNLICGLCGLIVPECEKPAGEY